MIELPFIGLLLSLLFIGATGLYPGGLIVPSYLALFVNQPLRLAATLLAALAAWGVFRLASQIWILFGRRRFVFMITAGALFAQAAARLLPGAFEGGEAFRVIGWVIPGLVANHFEGQGPVKTTLALIVVTVATALAGRLVGAV